MTDCGSVPPHLVSLENSHFLAVLDEGVTLVLGSLPLLALSLRVLPTLGSESEKIIAPIHGKTQVMWPSRSARRFTSQPR